MKMGEESKGQDYRCDELDHFQNIAALISSTLNQLHLNFLRSVPAYSNLFAGGYPTLTLNFGPWTLDLPPLHRKKRAFTRWLA